MRSGSSSGKGFGFRSERERRNDRPTMGARETEIFNAEFCYSDQSKTTTFLGYHCGSITTIFRPFLDGMSHLVLYGLYAKDVLHALSFKVLYGFLYQNIFLYFLM